MIYNRIPIVFGGLHKIIGPTISYQYDVTQFLVFNGLELPEYYEVDFCNEGDATTITMVGTADGVAIPDEFLQTGKRVKAYVVIHGEDEGAVETRYEVTIPVKPRPQRTDIQPTPAEQLQIDTLVDSLNDAIEALEQNNKEIDNGTLLYNVMGRGTTGTLSGKKFVVEKNKATVVKDGNGSTYRFCNLLGEPEIVAYTFSNADLSGQTFYDIEVSDGNDLFITLQWEKAYPNIRNSFCVATKNRTTNVITKLNFANDKANLPAVQRFNLFELVPEMRENGNLALFFEGRNADWDNTVKYWLTADKSDREWITSDEVSRRVLAGRKTAEEEASVVSLLHFSDIHGNGHELSRILEFQKSYSGYINDAICTGDMMANSAQSDFTWWTSHDTSKVLVTLGNHDYYISAADDHTKADIDATVKKWIGDYASGWNVTRPTGKGWYHKDYTGVRLIALDCNLTAAEGGTEQDEWLADVLDDALENDLAVIIATHYVYLGSNKTFTKYTNNFTSRYTDTTTTSVYDWSPKAYVETVQDFIDGGGDFVCWICGHNHSDMMRYPTDNPDQLVVSICAAAPERMWPNRVINDLYREAGTATEDAFNIVTVDPSNKCVKFARIGADITTFMLPRKMICYDYGNHEFV